MIKLIDRFWNWLLSILFKTDVRCYISSFILNIGFFTLAPKIISIAALFFVWWPFFFNRFIISMKCWTKFNDLNKAVPKEEYKYTITDQRVLAAIFIISLLTSIYLHYYVGYYILLMPFIFTRVYGLIMRIPFPVFANAFLGSFGEGVNSKFELNEDYIPKKRDIFENAAYKNLYNNPAHSLVPGNIWNTDYLRKK
ncbi:MAG: hypothetical protein J0H68_09355 [Sphingobacteriia bacterium]|nr:hypothetical protein [Sphingobacteriia bacterium]